MTRKILMIYPKYPDTFWSFSKVLPFINKKASFPPLGLLTVASMLPKEWDLKLVDLNVSSLTDDQIKWADMVFISAMLVQTKSAKDIICRSKNLGKIVVAGGPAFTAQHECFEGVDHFVLGEGETTVPLFLRDLKRGRTKKLYRSNNRPSLAKTPVPRWDLINTKDYANMLIQYSRGCPFNCEFCDIIIMNGRIQRNKDSFQVLKELQLIYDIGWRDTVFFVDDNFIGNKTRVKEVLADVIDWQKKHKYPFKFITEASINLSDDQELMALMRDANFGKVFLGFESPDTASLKECGKIHNMGRNIVESVEKIHQNGMQVMGGFIVGFDNDDEGIFKAQIDFIQNIGVVTAMVGLLTALPQTRLWHRLKEEGRLVCGSNGNNTSDCVNFLPRMGKDTLINGYKKIISEIYSAEQYFSRVKIMIKRYLPTVRSHLTKDRFDALLKSIWKIGFLSKVRWRYWELIIRTTFTNFKALPVAIELSIYWLHYEDVVRRATAC